MIAVLPSMIHPKQPFSDGLGDYLKTQKKKSRKSCDLQDSVRRERYLSQKEMSLIYLLFNELSTTYLAFPIKTVQIL